MRGDAELVRIEFSTRSKLRKKQFLFFALKEEHPAPIKKSKSF